VPETRFVDAEARRVRSGTLVVRGDTPYRAILTEALEPPSE
jgi:hypothetical protein